jgi:GDPmannose 4,6-dehydratase
MHVSCGILFNHESPRRGETFVTRKITRAVGRIKLGLQDALYLGNLDARRDWGFAGDYVRAMWLMLQKDEPGDYAIATGRSASVREFAEMAFSAAGLDADSHIRVDPRYLRPAEVDDLRGDASRALAGLGWRATISLEQLIEMMVRSDLELARREATLKQAGHATHVPDARSSSPEA